MTYRRKVNRLSDILIPIVLIFVVLGALDIPIYLVILAATVYLQAFIIHIPITGIFSSLIESIAKSSFLCVPFFILTGSLIQSSSLGTRLINCFVSLFKNVRAGIALACLIANAFFGAISGSAPAAVATFSKIVYAPLKAEEGDATATGLITSSGALSTIIPPSITLIIFGLATETSVTQLFMAGFFPGILLVGLVTLYLIWNANKRLKREAIERKLTLEELKKHDGPIFDWKEIKDSFIKGIPVLILPVIILGGIYSGLATPTEAGAIAALYSFIVPTFILRETKLSKLPSILLDAVRVTSQIFVLIACSTAFAQATAMAQLPQMITALFSNMNGLTFLFMLNILLLIVGCFFDSGAAILILSPLLMPTARKLGLDPVHLGMIFCVNLSIGMFTPPFGLNIYVAQSVLRKSMGFITRSVAPYVVIYIIGLLIITYVPQVSLWLPRVLF